MVKSSLRRAGLTHGMDEEESPDVTGRDDELKVRRSTGYRELDASAVMTLLKWKFQSGTVDHCLAIDSLGEMIGYLFGSGQTMRMLTEMEFHRRHLMNRHDKRALL